MHIRLIGFVLGFLLAGLRVSAAQDVESPVFFSNKDAEAAIERALTLVPRMKCGAGPCAEPTPEEFAAPPIEIEHARFALIVGARSARLRWCGLEWEDRAFIPMMRSLQQSGIQEMRTLAILQLIHNGQLSRDFGNLQALKNCDKTVRASLDAEHPKVEMAPWQRTVDRALLDESVADMLKRVMDEIGKSYCGLEMCEPATEAEKANPPLSIEEARRAMRVGLLSGTAEHCGLDWKSRIFLPFMAHHHRQLNMSPRQLAIVNMLHSTMQGYIADGYKKQGEACTAQMREALEKQLTRG